MTKLRRWLVDAGRFYVRTARDLEEGLQVSRGRRALFGATDLLATSVLPRVSGISDVLRHGTVARGAHLGFVDRADRAIG